ncbi:MAG: UDP-N-acetylmuramate dehydrogenase [Clostridia bacterium]|nr:UDP-N-acetylmuramate dehydrogenase [Clostridia bacterium]
MGIVESLRQIPDINFIENVNLGYRTSFGIGGKAKYFVAPESVYSVTQCIGVARNFGIDYKIIGNGTNILVSDKGYDGLVICTKNLNSVFLDSGEVISLCGTPLIKFVGFASGCGRTGAEGLCGIPATVGGAICQNAGAFGYTISDYLYEVTSIKDGKTVKRKKSACGFGYRTSVFKNSDEFIVSAKFRFKKRKKTEKNYFYERRKAVQPSGRTCGSVFTNPPSDYAGRLIECAGLKGVKIGGAQVSEKHANFIVAEENAAAHDVYLLINEIKRTVYEKFGVRLKEEVEYLGEF